MTEHTFDVTGGRVVIAPISDADSDRVNLVVEFKPTVCEEETCGGRTAAEWKLLYEEEVGAHRKNAEQVNHWMRRAIQAEDQLNKISRAFMDLHNLAKDVVGPKL